MDSIIEVDHLSKSFAGFQAVNRVSFTIQEQEIFSLLGPNGAGKTTTLSLLSTLLKPDSGDATLCGYSIVKDPMQVRKVIGVVPQEIALYDPLTARENLAFWGRMYGMGGKKLNIRVAEVLGQIGLLDKADQPVKTYSGGMKRRVNIGIGLLHQPSVLFMDEPTVGIDPQSRRNILDTVKELNNQGMTVLYTTHYMEEAEELSDRVGIIDHGQMIALGTQKDLTSLVGEHETICIHMMNEQDGPAVVEAVQSIPKVIQVSADQTEVMILVHDSEEALAPVITRINDNNLKIRSVDIQAPNLEAVFLHLTGRALRD